MLKYFLLGTIAYTGMAFVAPNTAYAQDTEQTDQSEEDWRNSKRKRKTNEDFDPITNPQGLGSGISLPPLEPIDTLPEDSRRHLQRQRAKVIAEMEFGEDVGDIPFEPSEEAKQDPALAAEEEEAWEVILTDLQGGGGGGGGGGDQQGEGGPNKVAVAGRGGGGTSSVTRGGSAQSASDILNQLKGLQAGNRTAGTGSGNNDTPQSTQTGGGQSPQDGTGQGNGQTTAPTGQAGDGNTQTPPAQQGQGQNQPQGDQGAAPSGNQAGQAPQAPESATRGGSASSTQDILSSIRGGQSGTSGQESGQGQGQGQAQSQQAQGNTGSGQSQSTGQSQGQDGADSGASGDGEQGGGEDNGGGANRSPISPEVGPLNLPGSDTQGNGEGARSSASDYLKGVLGEQTPETDN